MSRSANLEVRLPPGIHPSQESTEILIKKFLKECSKDSLLQFLFENSAMSRRFEKKSVKTRQLKLKYRKTALKNAAENRSEFPEQPKKKKKIQKTTTKSQ